MGLVRKSCGRLDLGARHLGTAQQEDVRRTGFRRTAPHDATDLSLVEWCAYGSGRSVAGVLVLPRGGSAQVVRYLTAALVQAGWTPRIVAGSVGGTGNPGHAATFFAGLPVSAADFTRR